MTAMKDTALLCKALLARHAKAIWSRFEEASADRSEAFVLVIERPDGGVDIRVEDRCMLADALRESGSASADTIDFVDLPPGEIMVMIIPVGDRGALVAPMSREITAFDGTA
jgi:hypothetical protein